MLPKNVTQIRNLQKKSLLFYKVIYHIIPLLHQIFVLYRNQTKTCILRLTFFCKHLYNIKFMQQYFPSELFDVQFNRVRKLVRESLIYEKKKKYIQTKTNTKEMRSCLAFPLHSSDNKLLSLLHED